VTSRPRSRSPVFRSVTRVAFSVEPSPTASGCLTPGRRADSLRRTGLPLPEVHFARAKGLRAVLPHPPCLPSRSRPAARARLVAPCRRHRTVLADSRCLPPRGWHQRFRHSRPACPANPFHRCPCHEHPSILLREQDMTSGSGSQPAGASLAPGFGVAPVPPESHPQRRCLTPGTPPPANPSRLR